MAELKGRVGPALGLVGVVAVVAAVKIALSGGLPFSHSAKTSPGSLLSSADQTMLAKLAPAIKCLNGPLATLSSAAGPFRKEVQVLSSAQPVSGQGAQVSDWPLFKATLSESDGELSEACAAELEKAAAAPPSLAQMDMPAREAAKALRDLHEPGKRWDVYVSQKSYLDDHFTQGRQLDAVLTPILVRLRTADAQLADVVHDQRLIISGHELAALDRHEGHSLRWNTLRAMIAARSLVDRTHSLAARGGLNASSLQAEIQPLQAAFDEAEAYVANHPGQMKPGSNGSRPAWLDLESYVSEELSAAKELHRTLASPPQESAQDSAGRLHTLIANVDDSFDNLVSAYNREQQGGA